MVIDTSALLAILLNEPERRTFTELIEADQIRLLSAASFLETAIIIDDRFGYEGDRDLRFLLMEAAIEVVDVTLEQVERVRHACRTFGKGNHPAALNFGDCFAYGLAKTTGEPLLFKGNDFARTDVDRVRPF